MSKKNIDSSCRNNLVVNNNHNLHIREEVGRVNKGNGEGNVINFGKAPKNFIINKQNNSITSPKGEANVHRNVAINQPNNKQWQKY